MPVFRLTPVEGTETDPLWRASSMRPYCVWIRAEDENKARSEVAKATAVAPLPEEPGQLAPWKNAGLVACEYDDSRTIAAGVIFVRRMKLPARAAQHLSA